MKENKKEKKLLKIIIIVLSLVICFTGGFFTHYLVQPKTIKKLSNILSVIENTAKDPNGNDSDFNSDDVAKQFVRAVLSNDDYAQYFTDEEYSENKTEGAGNYSGIGVSLYADYPVIYYVYGNSPAEKVGLKKGDQILKARKGDEEFNVTATTDEFVAFMKSVSENSEVELLVKREGEFLEQSFTLVKRKYVCSYVYYYDSDTALRFVSEGENIPQKTLFPAEKNEKLPSDTAHVIFRSFEGDSAKQLEEALSYFYSTGRTKLILDLRGNGGGYMDCLQRVASNFINNGGQKKNLVTEVEERGGSSSYYTLGNKFNSQLENVVVLADGGTASASECLIGAMLCYGDANFSSDNLLIEYNSQRGNYSTYGKGIMQTTYRLLSGGALKLTTARIYWPDRETCIHGTGVVQDKVDNQINSTNAISRAIEILSK